MKKFVLIACSFMFGVCVAHGGGGLPGDFHSQAHGSGWPGESHQTIYYPVDEPFMSNFVPPPLPPRQIQDQSIQTDSFDPRPRVVQHRVKKTLKRRPVSARRHRQNKPPIIVVTHKYHASSRQKRQKLDRDRARMYVRAVSHLIECTRDQTAYVQKFIRHLADELADELQVATTKLQELYEMGETLSRAGKQLDGRRISRRGKFSFGLKRIVRTFFLSIRAYIGGDN